MSSEISLSFLTLNNILSFTFQSGSSEDGLPEASFLLWDHTRA